MEGANWFTPVLTIEPTTNALQKYPTTRSATRTPRIQGSFFFTSLTLDDRKPQFNSRMPWAGPPRGTAQKLRGALFFGSAIRASHLGNPRIGK